MCTIQGVAQPLTGSEALATVRRFNATLSAKGYVWFWPKIAAALTSKHHWLVIACDSCDEPNRIEQLFAHPANDLRLHNLVPINIVISSL
jgi:hypothetical protein